MTVEKLRELGVNVDDGLARCLNDEGFYLALVPDALKRERYEELETKIRMKDLAGAFEAAHGLKGILANLALTPIMEPVDRITELLRTGTEMDYGPLIKEIWDAYKPFEEII